MHKNLQWPVLSALAVIVLILSACGQSQPDYTPFGDGMKAIGICLVVCAVVNALASLVRGENKSEPSEKKHPDDSQKR